MTVALVMVAANERDLPARAIQSAAAVCDLAIILDTGTDPMEYGDVMPVEVVDGVFTDFGQARTDALTAARDRADWLLMLDADMTIQAHPDLRDWLNTDPDPDVAAWQVELREQDIRYRLPLLTRAGADVRYEGATHEALVCSGKQRPLLGLTVTHHVDGTNRADKHERDLELLAPGVMTGDPRSTYYSAQALRCLGNEQAAAELYERRSVMTGTWEEERWHAQYMAARLRTDVDALVRAFQARPWRPEPLEWAARFSRENATHQDVLFLESDPHERMGPCQS